jgi:RNA polymerase sigma-70 factor (ECF subfamily)
MSRIQGGDERALEGLYDESAALVYGLALRMLSDTADAEEVTADVYSHVWRSAASWDDHRGTVSTWLVMLCRSRCIDRIRSRRSRRNAQQALQPEPMVDNRVESYEREVVRRVMCELDSADRTLIELAFFDGLTHTELAAKLGLPLGTVKTRIRSAIQQMRNLLKECQT